MKILLFTENYHRGGVDTFIVMLLNNWPDEADDFTLICNEDHPGLQDIRNKLRRPCHIVTHRIPTFSSLAIKNLNKPVRNLLRKIATPILKYLMLVYAIVKLRPILCSQDYERLLVVNGGYPSGDTCRAAGIAWGMFSDQPRSIHNYHNLSIASRPAMRIQENLVDTLLSRYTQAFVTVSQAAAISMSLRPCIPMDKVTYIYNGLEDGASNPSSIDIRNELSLAADASLCLMLGTYEPRKGHVFLLQVFRKVVDSYPTAHLLICGFGTTEEISGIQEYIQELLLHDNVHLMNFRSDALSILNQADVLLVASQEFESFGLTCVEAMARHIPVVATDVGGLPEVVENSDGGYCVNRKDVGAFAEQTIRLLLDDNLRKEQGRKGYERYQRHFTAGRMSKEYAKLLAD